MDYHCMILPKVSVITICYNSATCIEKTIVSVVSQTYPRLEYIVIDGKSQDKTDSIINRYLKQVDVYISETDNGIYDAMNKGLIKITGEWVIFMNAGDIFFHKKVLENIFMNDNITDDIDIITGCVCYDTGKIFCGQYNDMLYIKNGLHHQGTFYRTSLFNNRIYNTKFRILADYDFNLFLYKKGVGCKSVDSIISLCSDGGISTKISIKKLNEELEMKSQYLSGIYWLFVKMLIYVKFVIRICVDKWRQNVNFN